jgi:hypothetical protein
MMWSRLRTPLNTTTPLLIALCGLAACQATAAETCTPSPVAESQVHSSFTKESAIVEDVLSTLQDGYRSRAYVVVWHGTRVLVSDPLAESNKNAGERIDFIASRNEVNGNRILAFITTEEEPHQSVGAPGPSSLQASSTTATGVVEQVFNTQDDGFRFSAYIVRSHDRQIAVSDPLALSHHINGEQIDYLALRTALPLGRLLDSQVQLSAAERNSASKPQCGFQSSRETGVVDHALLTEADGYAYRAYVVAWRGAQIVIEDPSAATLYQPGDSVNFWVSRFQLPAPGGHKDQQFSFDRRAQTTDVDQPLELQTASAMETAPVQAVFASEVDGYRSVAYLVDWHNTSVAVIDAFGTTHFRAGDRITFSVARSTTPSLKGLNFMLFDFPTHR